MTNSWKKLLLGATAAVLTAAVPASVRAAGCGDVNNDGVLNASDCLVLAQCLAGLPACTPATLCGGAGLASCGDMFKDGDVSISGLSADLSVCNDTVAKLPTTYDACQGPGPVHAGCPGNVTINSGDITSSETWPANCHITIDGTVFIGDHNGNPLPHAPVIKIEKGSVIHALTSGADPAALIFLPGSHIDAQGTPAQPIIITSGAPAGARHQGDWGGLEFLGKSTVNNPACQGSAEGIPLAFGGCIANDTSGVMSFVRVEYGGQIFTPNNELNDITFNAIGSTTQFNFLAAVAGDDDTFEWFGGTSHHHHFYSASSADDNFDTQLGFTGTLQYGIAIQNGLVTQSGRDARGIESDNSEFDFEATPRDNPTNCNLTMIGANKQAGTNDGSDSGVLIRRGGDYLLGNSIVQDFQDSGFEIRDVSTATQACNAGPALTGKVLIESTVFYDNGSSHTDGAACEEAKDNDGTLDQTAGADIGACAAAGCNCDSESLLHQFVLSHHVSNDSTVNPDGSTCPGAEAVNTGISSQYPALDNTGCTGLETPLVCCTGAGTGTCRALPNVFPHPTAGAFPAAFNCKTFNPILDDNTTANYIGAVNPTTEGACVFTGASAHCDWLSKPWIESSFQ